MKIDFTYLCETGLQRKENQDAVYAYHLGKMALFLVADGMGGHTHGEEASRALTEEAALWCQSFSEKSYANDFHKMVDSVRGMLSAANQKVWQEHAGNICGAVFVLLFFYGDKYAIFSSGDARVYQKCIGKFMRLTCDDVWENQAKRTRKEREDLAHPHRGRVTNALGVKKDIQLRVLSDRVTQKSVFLLCSDGLYKQCLETMIKRQMEWVRWGMSLKKAVMKLRETVYVNGAVDNLSIILVKVW